MPDKSTFTSHRAFLTLLVLMPLVISNGCEAQSDKKPTSAEEFATSVLNIYRSKDVSKLLALSPDGPPPVSELSRYAPGTPRHNSLFGDKSWRWKAVQNWNGKFAEARFKRNVLVQFSPTKTSGDGNFVSLKMEDGKWKFSYMSLDNAAHPGTNEYRKLTTQGADNAILKDAQAAAVTVLNAFQKEDFDAVLKLSGAEGPSELMELSDEDSKKPKSHLLFSAKQMAGVANWNGKVGAAYIREAARVEFGRSGSSVYVVTMIRMGEEWKFEDIHSPDIEDFEAWNKE